MLHISIKLKQDVLVVENNFFSYHKDLIIQIVIAVNPLPADTKLREIVKIYFLAYSHNYRHEF